MNTQQLLKQAKQYITKPVYESKLFMAAPPNNNRVSQRLANDLGHRSGHHAMNTINERPIIT